MITRYVVLCLLLCSCGNSAAPTHPPSRRQEFKGEFKSKIYHINEYEHVTVFELPARGAPDRCATYVNEKTRTSHMRCDFDASVPIPEGGVEMEQ